MSVTSTYRESVSLERVGFNVLSFFMVIGLLRLTNMNYYLSKMMGLETQINNTGGDAFNFVNYLGVGALVVIIISKLTRITLSWASAKWIYSLIGIYLINGFIAPYTNLTWLIYQVLFLLIAIVVHLLTLKVADVYLPSFQKSMQIIFILGLVFLAFTLIVILSQVSIANYITEFNDSFVQSLDDFGIMKQRFGYFIGFLLSYAIFIEKRISYRVTAIALIMCTGFGIRSFILGLIGAGFVFTIRTPKYFIAFATILGISFYILLSQYFELLIYDTRFYPILNALDIVQKFPFGVGIGGYPVYTEENARILFGEFYDVRAILDFIPIAPESDLVHIFGSLGLGLGLLHLLIQFRIIWLSYRLQDLMDPFHKCILFYFAYMTFFGISEDNIFSINYWIFFGVASGIVTYLLHKRRTQQE